MKRAPSPEREKYGLLFPETTNDLEVEFFFIRNGGFYQAPGGKPRGHGLFEHYKNAMTLIWPEDDWHRWALLSLKEILDNKITGIMGCQNSAKTYGAAKYALTDYWAFPSITLTLVSSTDMRGLELRVWGTIKQLFNRALEKYPHLDGHVLESLHTITTDKIKDEKKLEGKKARVLKKGIICIPCLQSGRYVGLGKYQGSKSKRLRLIADEAAVMGSSFLDAIANLGGNNDFKAVLLGNPVDPQDPLGLACEPKDGWASIGIPEKTKVWETRFLNGKCINLVGFDSPNFDFPQVGKPHYPYLIHKGTLDEVAAFWGLDSQQYWSQCGGVMRTGLLARRVITRDLCRDHHAFETAVWEGVERTRIYAIDAAYSGTGGDRCVGGWIEFGKSTDGTTIIRVNPPVIIPVVVVAREGPEDQIAKWAKKDTEAAGIPPENIFYDSTGRGTLGSAFARVFGTATPVPVEFGGRPSSRPVRHDLFVTEDGQKRHKRCDEHYVDRVSEFWFSVRYVIESDQLRELPEDVMKEGCAREYGTAKGNKFFVESKHDKKARERMGRSPDLFDWLATAIEGARQRGFEIQRLGVILIEEEDVDWYDKEEEEYQELIQSKLLQHAV